MIPAHGGKSIIALQIWANTHTDQPIGSLMNKTNRLKNKNPGDAPYMVTFLRTYTPNRPTVYTARNKAQDIISNNCHQNATTRG